MDQSRFLFSPAFPQIRFSLKSQFNSVENRMGFLFPLSCLLLLAFWNAPTARPVTRASKLIKTHSAQFKPWQTSLGATQALLW